MGLSPHSVLLAPVPILRNPGVLLASLGYGMN
jgi:hypothetical protein